MNRKSIGKIITTILMSIIMCFNVLLLPARADEKSEERTSENSNIEVIIKSDKGEIRNGDHLNFKLEYKAKNGYGSINPGDQISFKIPSWMKGIKFNFPPQHFNDSKIDGDMIVATFGENSKKALSGYISVSGIADNITTEKTETIQVKVNGVVVGSENVVVTPKDKINGGDNKPNIVNRKLLKDVDGSVGYDSEGNIVSNVYFPALGKIKEYTIYVNEEYSYMYNARLMDKMPEGMELVEDSLKITKIDLSNNSKEVTNNINIYKDSKQLDINFGNINSKYIVKYKARITNENERYINKAILYENNESLTSTVIVNNKKEKTHILDKQSYNTEQVVNDKNETVNVASNGEDVKYRISLNKNKVSLENVRLEDFIPKGMAFVPKSLRIGKYDKENNFSWVSDKDKINYENNKLSIDFGDIEDFYIIYYDTKIKGVEREYNNKAVVSYDNTTKESIDKVYYKINVGAINAYKDVDKNKIKKDDNQTVVYSIKFESFGIFEKGYLNVVDKLNKNVKIVNIEAPEHFTVDVDKDSNTVKVVNDKKEVEYGENLEIKIYTNFRDVENGTTISNIANINDEPTNKVETKKGYAFQGIKVDSKDESLRLEGAKFLLKDKDKKTVKTLISDENGVVKSDLDTFGTYYIQEIEAPKGYNFTDKEWKFEVDENDIGTTINLGKIKNQKNEKPPVVPDEKPPVPEEKPKVPDEKPPVPEEKPKVPDEKPPVPEEKPKVPDEKPPVPEEKPKVPDEKPPVPEEKPKVPDEKPSVPEEKPKVPDEKPPVPEEKPKVPDEKPPVPEEKPKNINSPKTGDLSLAPNVGISVISISTLYILNRKKFKNK